MRKTADFQRFLHQPILGYEPRRVTNRKKEKGMQAGCAVWQGVSEALRGVRAERGMIDAGYGQEQGKKRLKAELRHMNAGLKQRYGLSPRMVQHQIDRYGDELEKINKQIEDMERSQQEPGRDDGHDR